MLPFRVTVQTRFLGKAAIAELTLKLALILHRKFVRSLPEGMFFREVLVQFGLAREDAMTEVTGSVSGRNLKTKNRETLDKHLILS